jgi:putative addiction module killer protein
MYEVRHYRDRAGRDSFQDWLDSLKDVTARVAVQRRVDRLGKGNFGSCGFCRGGVWELKIDHGPGYRVYYARIDKTVILLLAGGGKRTQDVDIERAVKHFAEYQRQQP